MQTKIKELNDIAYHFILTKHAEERIQERFETLDRNKIKMSMLNSILSYKNTDNSFNIAINEFEYFVVKYNEYGIPIIITFKERSHNNISVYDKYILALKGVMR
jgi:hypothetical protein